jgi:transcription elongation GreA/GreB family factor
VGKKVGDRVEVEVPAGKNRFEILDIRFEEE